MRDNNFIIENNAKHLWHPMGAPGDSINNPPKVITNANGSQISDIDGHTTVDAVGGLWCVNLGYSNQAIKKAISEQLDLLPYYSGFAGTTNPAAIEASFMVKEMFKADGMEKVFFTSGGSDSVETCLRSITSSSIRPEHSLQENHRLARLLWPKDDERRHPSHLLQGLRHVRPTHTLRRFESMLLNATLNLQM